MWCGDWLDHHSRKTSCEGCSVEYYELWSDDFLGDVERKNKSHSTLTLITAHQQIVSLLQLQEVQHLKANTVEVSNDDGAPYLEWCLSMLVILPDRVNFPQASYICNVNRLSHYFQRLNFLCHLSRWECELVPSKKAREGLFDVTLIFTPGPQRNHVLVAVLCWLMQGEAQVVASCSAVTLSYESFCISRVTTATFAVMKVCHRKYFPCLLLSFIFTLNGNWY